MSSLRFNVVEDAFKKRPVQVAAPEERPSEFYGKYVFNRAKMFKYLPARTYQKYCKVLSDGLICRLPTRLPRA